MPQNLDQRLVNNLIKGLITEAGELTFPENASIDELNCSLARDGSRSRRLGLEYENGATNSSFTIVETEVFQTGEWRNAGNVANFNLMVVQYGDTLGFYASNEPPYSAQEQSYTVNLATYQIAGKVASDYPCQFSSLQGFLVVVSEAINPILVELDTTTDTLTVTQISLKVRDYEWQSTISTLPTSIPSGTASNARKYDTYNAGWSLTGGSTALNTYISARTAYPPLTHPWFSGKNGTTFSVTEWEAIDGGTSLAANGRVILDFFNKDRSAVSGISGLSVETEANRFKTVASFAGRVWYAGLASGVNSGKVLYSQVIENVGEGVKIGLCYQSNDPTSEYFSDLLDTDGGVINIPEADNIKKLYQYNQFLFVFADNGVWVISGTDDRFSPTSYYVSKVTNVGIYDENSFVAAEGIPFWWSKVGIHTFSFDETSGYPVEQNISLSTIQSFWDNLDVNAKGSVKAAYDPINKRIFWYYPENDETILNRYRNFLILDIPLQAFYPWQVAGADDYVMGLFFFDGYGDSIVSVNVTDSSGATVTTGAGNVTVNEPNLLLTASTQLAALCFQASNSKMSVALFSSTDFLDWGSENYSSYVEAGHDFMGDMVLKKNAPYVVVYCRSTEEGFTGNEVDGYEPINPSSVLLKAYWDFKTEPSSSQQAYRIKPFITVDSMNLADNQQLGTVVTTRLKVRGRGRTMRLRFESEQGKNFVLLGYGVIVGANSRF